MMSGLILGKVMKVGEPPPVARTVNLGGPNPKKEIPYAGFSGIFGHYEVQLESAEVGSKRASFRDPRTVVALQPVAKVYKFTGSYRPCPPVGAPVRTSPVAIL